jgi:hypothetical protein
MSQEQSRGHEEDLPALTAGWRLRRYTSLHLTAHLQGFRSILSTSQPAATLKHRLHLSTCVTSRRHSIFNAFYHNRPARRALQAPGVPSRTSVLWRGDWAIRHNTRHDHSSGGRMASRLVDSLHSSQHTTDIVALNCPI